MTDNSRAIDNIRSAKCISLATFRRDGTKVATPIWFNVIDGKIHVTTEPGSWKVKRVTNNTRVEFAVCTQRGKITGPWFGGTARVVSGAQLTPVLAAKKRRYFSFRLIHLLKRDQVGIEITPDA